MKVNSFCELRSGRFFSESMNWVRCSSNFAMTAMLTGRSDCLQMPNAPYKSSGVRRRIIPLHSSKRHLFGSFWHAIRNGA
ncbi:hypothetical protein AVEN_127212-1 [Araneus ventricosus]|uniref:Uncharacterized protein n=1 Tax=Araneus ventricosus TaxID=182803 RepID=A0A4Y2VPE0_ARAVE|nr:hypothetical protein AVEN_246844-1 [Araneus ventricosus]GBO26482.1 hypothetical protein AVEN_127212-1 [Araneus ventricosus]